MANTITARVAQVDISASQGSVRDHQVMVDRPPAKGGHDAGMMGGEMLLISLGGCFMSNLLEAIRTREADIKNVEIEVSGTLDGAPAFYTAIAMRISAEYADRAQMEKLVTISERSCIVALTLKSAVDLTLEVV